MSRAEFRVEGGTVRLVCADATPRLDENRPFRPADAERLAGLTSAYRTACRTHTGAALAKELLGLGRDLYAWLEGDASWLSRLGHNLPPPLALEIAAPLHPTPDEERFLEAPWELLAPRDRTFLGEDPRTELEPIRRLGRATAQPPPSAFRLSILFMAAAPTGVRVLDFEAEEAAILRACDPELGAQGLDLVVEESGELRRLAVRVADPHAPPDVLHLSCHGTLRDGHADLLLETDEGAPETVSADALGRELGEHRPRLIFLSACHSAEASGIVDSTARAMVARGFPAVLGWAAAVGDVDATLFASTLYRRLSLHESVEAALAAARRDLLRPPSRALPEPSDDWHLARLYLGPAGGGVLASGTARRAPPPDTLLREFLDPRTRQVPVARPAEFVGRRRQLQAVLRALRKRTGPGVLIHGLGRHGKSSLAARVRQRLAPHALALVFGEAMQAYHARSLLERCAQAIGTDASRRLIEAALPDVDRDAGRLESVLRQLLEGECRQERPLLLVIDDLERILIDPLDDGLHRVHPDLVATLRAVIRGFAAAADTDSRLLFTSRYRFTLPDGARDRGKDLAAVHVPPMLETESRKQAGAHARLALAGRVAVDVARIQRCIRAGRGNPGLQDLLHRLAQENAAAFDHAVAEIEGYLAGGHSPEDQTVASFLANLALDHLLGLLSPGESAFLRSTTLFTLPVPRPVVEQLAHALGLGDPARAVDRLLALGVCDEYTDAVDRERAALGVNPFVRPKLPPLAQEERAALAKLVVEPLFEAWGGGAGSARRGFDCDIELCRLGVAGQCAPVVLCVGKDAIRGLAAASRNPEAVIVAKEALALLGRSSASPGIGLLRAAGEAAVAVGETPSAREWYRQALAAVAQAKPDAEEHTALLIAHARLLVDDGSIQEGLDCLETAERLLSAADRQRERAVVLGEVAWIKVARGQVDEALKLHEEELRVYEALGDARSRAVTLGDIARIKVARGQVDEALKLQEERLHVNEALGDQDGQAAALWDRAQIRLSRQEGGAIEDLVRSCKIFEAIGRAEGIAVVGSLLGRILALLGRRDPARHMLERSCAALRQLGREDEAKELVAIIEELRRKGEPAP
ncbi:MAG: CHAT domain-containing protein [Planctomycetes bacterium]|nr:CHAT domain-containing protein [Planctomycetota bacterium]